jgi:hypothetical protein
LYDHWKRKILAIQNEKKNLEKENDKENKEKDIRERET